MYLGGSFFELVYEVKTSFIRFYFVLHMAIRQITRMLIKSYIDPFWSIYIVLQGSERLTRKSWSILSLIHY